MLTVFAGMLPAVDSQLLNLVMPDAKVLAGVNVTQAKSSPFGQYVLSQIAAGNDGIAQLAALTGFDPSRDVNELLLASNGAPGGHAGLATATGTFNAASIASFATGHGGVAETYAGVTILEDPKLTHGIAFLSESLVAAGDIADVKAAIDRRANPSILPAALVTQVQQLGAADDAWALTTVPPSSLRPASAPVPNSGLAGSLLNALGNVQSVSGGVKFGATVNFGLQAQADNAQDATALAGVVQFLVSMAQLNGANNPQAAAALQSLSATAQGSTVNIALS
ncbi:MAG: hypothetical protein ACHQIO_19915, partial [Nevskiales bacterium]